MNRGRENGLMTMYAHYGAEIMKECDNFAFRRSIGIGSTDAGLAKSNEKLYKLFMYRNGNNTSNIRKKDNQDHKSLSLQMR